MDSSSSSTARSHTLGDWTTLCATRPQRNGKQCPPAALLHYTHLAFDPAVSSHFHLVQFQVEDDEEFLSVHAYSSETGTWGPNQIEEQEEEGQLEGWRQLRFNLGSPQQCPFVNGFLHLVVWDQDQTKIVAVDVQGKATRMIAAPHVPARRHWMCYFGESQGHLHYITQEMLHAREGKYKLSIWVLQDYDTQEWVLKDTVNTDEAFGEDLEVVDIHQDCDVVFVTHPLGYELVAYDMGSKEVSLVATLEDQKRLLSTARYVPNF